MAIDADTFLKRATPLAHQHAPELQAVQSPRQDADCAVGEGLSRERDQPQSCCRSVSSDQGRAVLLTDR